MTCFRSGNHDYSKIPPAKFLTSTAIHENKLLHVITAKVCLRSPELEVDFELKVEESRSFETSNFAQNLSPKLV